MADAHRPKDDEMKERTMEAGERAELEGLMARMAEGDTLALFRFLDRYHDRLVATVRRLVEPFGRHDLWRDRSQIEALVQTAALAIFDHASSWSADGALPWTWAERAIRADLVAWIGHPHDELPVDAADEIAAAASPRPDAAAGPGRTTAFVVDGVRRGVASSSRVADLQEPAPPRPTDDLAGLAAREPVVALLWAAIQCVASPRDTDVHIQYRIQKRLGDRSPARTVGAEFGLAPDNVRQIDRRVRRKLGLLIERDPTFGALRELPWLAA